MDTGYYYETICAYRVGGYADTPKGDPVSTASHQLRGRKLFVAVVGRWWATAPGEVRILNTDGPRVKFESWPNNGNLSFKYYWRVKTRLPERKGTACRVLIRGKLNSALVEFEDGFKVITSRNYLRKIKSPPTTPTRDNGEWAEPTYCGCPLILRTGAKLQMYGQA